MEGFLLNGFVWCFVWRFLFAVFVWDLLWLVFSFWWWIAFVLKGCFGFSKCGAVLLQGLALVCYIRPVDGVLPRDFLKVQGGVRAMICVLLSLKTYSVSYLQVWVWKYWHTVHRLAVGTDSFWMLLVTLLAYGAFIWGSVPRQFSSRNRWTVGSLSALAARFFLSCLKNCLGLT